MTLLDIVGEPLLVHGMKSRRGREERVAELLRMVGLRMLDSPKEFLADAPHCSIIGVWEEPRPPRGLARP